MGRFLRQELTPLWKAARSRVERNGLDLGSSRLAVPGLTIAERDAVSGLVGQRWTADETIKLDLRKLDEQLRRMRGEGLLALLEALGGPLIDRRAERSLAASTKSAGWLAARDHPALVQHPPLVGWVDRLRRSGRLIRLGSNNPFALLVQALDVLAELPSEPMPLAVLAVVRTGSAHGLDVDQPLGILATEAVQAVTGEPGRRAAWRAMGVELDAVSASVLALGLGGHPILNLANTMGEPVRITWRMLENFVPTFTDRVLWVCENPVVIDAAANELGPRCAPIVCTDGMPAGVVWRLLDRVRSAGVEVRIHADFDIGGLRIAAAVIRRTGARPWRYDAVGYLAALGRPSTSLVGNPPSTPWDPALQDALEQHRRAIHEEALLDVLLGDLG